jgi:Raf kinase inhibitor-like YbhB/YbcL family protein
MCPVPRRSVLAAAALGLAGCSSDDGNGGDDTGGSGTGGGTTARPDNPALASAEGSGSLSIRSAAFEAGGTIPQESGKNQSNVNPPLEIDGVPDDAGSLALVVDDPDAVDVVGEIFVHWLVWNVRPDLRSIPENWDASAAIEGENDFGDVGYGGPAPPDEPHTYRFKCFAVDGTLEFAAGVTVEDLGPALSGRILARAQVTGTYAPS